MRQRRAGGAGARDAPSSALPATTAPEDEAWQGKPPSPRPGSRQLGLGRGPPALRARPQPRWGVSRASARPQGVRVPPISLQRSPPPTPTLGPLPGSSDGYRVTWGWPRAAVCLSPAHFWGGGPGPLGLGRGRSGNHLSPASGGRGAPPSPQIRREQNLSPRRSPGTGRLCGLGRDAPSPSLPPRP